jgi:hypothetical protein
MVLWIFQSGTFYSPLYTTFPLIIVIKTLVPAISYNYIKEPLVKRPNGGVTFETGHFRKPANQLFRLINHLSVNHRHQHLRSGNFFLFTGNKVVR